LSSFPDVHVPLTIFVHRASECLTDHLSHGDGLICFSLLNELAQRGNRIFAYTNRNGVHERPENMTILARRHIVPANSLGPWENAWRANRWLRRLQRQHQIDLVWRMHPYEGGCPAKPYTGKRPLVVGPLFYGWPQESSDASRVYGPRLGLGIGNLVAPLARRGWNRTLKAASLVLCATDSLAEQIRPLTRGRVITLPVIVDPPADLASLREPGRFPHLLFVANLVANKRPLVFCEMIQILRQKGILATGTVLGDGPQRPILEQWCQNQNLGDAVRFLGRITNADVYRNMATADGLVSTSYGEPYGRNIAEAMSVGTVPICHRSGGPADFVASGKDGLLVDGLEGAAYADAIASSWTAPGTWKRLSAGALQKAGQWKPRVVIDQLEDALRDLVPSLAAPGGGARQDSGDSRNKIASHRAIHQESVG